MDGVFDGIDEKLNTKFESILEEEKNKLDVIRDKQVDVQNIIEDEREITLEQKEFMINELKDMLESSNDVLTTLKNELKVGTGPRMWEVYSTLVNARTEQMKEMRSLSSQIAKIKIMDNELKLKKIDTALKIDKNKRSLEGDDSGEVTLTKTWKLKGSDLQSIIQNARRDSELNQIEIEEIVSDEDKNVSRQ
jgi:hypothetical protein